MVIQETILAAYNSIIKRIRSGALPLIMVLLLATAAGRTNPWALTYFSTIQLTSLHLYLGWGLCLICIVLVYDLIFRLLSRRDPLSTNSSVNPAAVRQQALKAGHIYLLSFSVSYLPERSLTI